MKINRIVYRLWHSNSARGRIGYIGKSRYGSYRMNLHIRKLEKGCRKLYRALRKYPLSLWHTEILASGFNSDSKLNEAEIRFISKFDSKNKGYNLTDGGDGLNNPSKETRALMSEIAKNRKFSAETRAKMSKHSSGERNPNYGVNPSSKTRKLLASYEFEGKKHSKKTLAKMRKAQKLRRLKEKSI